MGCTPKGEQRVSLNSYFVTLTYDDSNLSISDTGFPTLVKTDMQKFLKRLRKRVEAMPISDYNHHMASSYSSHKAVRDANHGIRYYAVGEYGTRFHRPHYHLLLFNLPSPVMMQLHTIWSKGHVHVGEINIKTIMYCLSYHITRDPKASLVIDRQPEFVTMSRRPGIGHTYIAAKSKWNKQNEFLYVMNDGFRMRLPRYWKDKIFTEDERNLLTERLLDKIKEENERLYEELRRVGYENHDIHHPIDYLHSLNVKQSERHYKKIIKGQIF